MAANSPGPAPTSSGISVGWLLVGVATLGLLCWHLSLVVLADGLPFTGLSRTIKALVQGHPTHIEGAELRSPLGAAAIALALFVVVTALLVTACVWFVGRRHRSTEGLATWRMLRDRVRGIHNAQPTAAVARLSGKPVHLTTEDTVMVIAPPRKGKSAMLAIPVILDAPGAVVTTATKVDVLRATITRRRAAGQIYILNPENIGVHATDFYWDIFDGCADVVVADRRAAALVAAGSKGGSGGDGNLAFFEAAAQGILQCYLHAAALDGADMLRMLAWARNYKNSEPFEVLENHPGAAAGMATKLRGLVGGESEKTIASTMFTLNLALDPFTNPYIRECVTPPGPGESARAKFDIAQFVESRDTLYILSESRAKAAALFTALIEEIQFVAGRTSQQRQSGRLDPPMYLVLDEVANVSPLPSLPSLMSDGGGRGVCTWAIFQSMGQAVDRWGRDAAQTLKDSAAALFIMGGLRDADFLEWVSKLVGEHEQTRTSTSESPMTGPDGQGLFGPTMQISTTTQWVEKRILPSAKIRELEDGTSLLFYRDVPAAVVRLTPWWNRADSKDVQAAVAQVIAHEQKQLESSKETI